MSAPRKSRKGSALWLVAAMVLGVAAVPAVIAAESASAKSGQGGGLVLLQWQFPSRANPYLSQGTKDLLTSSLVLEPLAEIAPDGTLVPALAAEIPTQANGGISDDLTQITWTLQSGVLWSDGSPLTADDVVFTWEYCRNQATGCVSSSFGNVASVVAVGDGKVTVRFTDPTPYPFLPFVGYTS
ncbi:MAG: ABC transporter substrate-binding protein, partial [Acidimicrobiia bacterium]